MVNREGLTKQDPFGFLTFVSVESKTSRSEGGNKNDGIGKQRSASVASDVSDVREGLRKNGDERENQRERKSE